MLPKSTRKYEKTLVVPIDKDMWQELRKVCFELEISMSHLARSGIKKMLKKYQKQIDSK